MPHCVQYCSEAVIKGVTEDLGHHARKKKKIKAVLSALVAVAKYKRWRGGKKFMESGLMHPLDSGSVVGS